MRYAARTFRSLLLAVGSLLAAHPAGAKDPLPPTTVALTLDTSGSVGAAQLTRARDLALAILAALPAGSEVAVLTFDDQSRVVVPRTSRPDEVRQRLAGLQVRGRYTALHDALYDASHYVRDAPGARKAIVLITDGVDENSALNLEDGLRLATDAHIPVIAVGVGPHPQERVLRRIAKLTGGDYFAFDRAAGPELAALIAAAPPAAPAPSTPAASGAAAGQDPRAPAPGGIRSASSPTTAPSRLTIAGPRRLLWAGLSLTALVAVALFVLTRRRRPLPACPDCGRALPAGSSTCPSCAAAPTRIPGRMPPPRREDEPDLSETVLSRMNTTEEYLERTITLQERPVLVITRGPGVGQVFELGTTSATSIGRSRANDILVDDVSVSGQHCRIRPEDGGFVLHDLKSTNGTLVNEKKVSRHVLAEGDVIAIGETSLQFRREMKRG